MGIAAESPVRPKAKVFYGWWIVAVSVAGAFIGASNSQLFAGSMLPDIERATGWSRSSITLAVTLGGMASGFVAPLFGRLADQHGTRGIASVAVLVTSCAMFLVALSSEFGLLLFYAAFIVARCFSQNGLAGVVPRTAAVNWFRRKRGRALGLLSMAIPLGGAALVPLGKAISDQFGWQTTYYVFGAALLCLFPVMVLVLRRRPEDMGLLPDGAVEPPPAPTDEAAAARIGEGRDWTLQEAMRTHAFWLLIGAMTLGTFANGAIGFHQAAFYEDQGIAASAAALTISVYALSGAFANGMWGFLVERFSERLLGAGTLLVAGVLPVYLLTVESFAGALVFAVLFGLAARGEGALVVIIQAQYFGRGSFGTISGFSVPFQQVALGLGPTVAALTYEIFDKSYAPAFLFFGVLYLASSLMIWLARRPAPPVALNTNV